MSDIEALDDGLEILLSVPKSVAAGDIVIGDIVIPCAVLENEIRVVSQGGVERALGRSRSRGKRHGGELPTFLYPKALKPFINKKLLLTVLNPIIFSSPNGKTAHGLKAELLPEVCNIWVQADRKGVLKKNQKHIAERAGLLLSGFAHIGVIGLVDEATGYQDIRDRRALAAILERFLADKFQKWTKTFPIGFYEGIFKLKDWTWTENAGGKKPPTPQVIGHYTNDIVYSRIAPGVLAELRRLNPKLPSGNRRSTHQQWFTPDSGHPALKEHLAAVIALMRASPNWGVFNRNLNRAFPKQGDTLSLPLDDEE